MPPCALPPAHTPGSGDNPLPPCDFDCYEPPDDDDDPFNPSGFLSVQSWETTSSGITVTFYQPASAGCPGDPPSSPPPGVPQEFYQDMNPVEKELCWSNPSDCGSVWLAKLEAEDFAGDAGYYSGIPGPHNGPQDALRHAMWSAEITQRIGISKAEIWTDAHELDFDFSPPQVNMDNLETVMDLFNNQVGMGIGDTNVNNLRQAILQALGDGLLQEWVCPEIGSPFPEDCA